MIFTDRALSEWKTSGYPHREKMRDHLIRLAEAAVAWRAAGGSIGGRLEDWFTHDHQLTMSPVDGTLKQMRGHKFDFEGTSYNREPHLKLDDSTCPSEVGRVYFARDFDNLRFIVDHVGLKLYGLK
jgi:hypothetical protein